MMMLTSRAFIRPVLVAHRSSSRLGAAREVGVAGSVGSRGRLAVLAVDFDDTLTTHETTGLIAELGIRRAPDEAAARAAWAAIVAAYASDRAAILAAVLPADRPPAAVAESIPAAESICAALRAAEERSVARVEDSGLLGGIMAAELEHAGRGVTLRPGAIATLGAAARRGVNVALVSATWAPAVARGALAPLEPVFCGGVAIVASGMLFDGEGVATGRLARPLMDAAEKAQALTGMARAAAGGRSVYVGDSLTDLLALLAADVGVVLAPGGAGAVARGSLGRACWACGFALEDLGTGGAAAVGGGAGPWQPRRLWVARDWCDIATLLELM